MKALTWHGKRDVRVDTVPDPSLQEPTDAIIKVTSSGLCGSDLHLYEVLAPFLDAGDVLGHEPMGIVQEVGPQVTHIAPGDRVVVPFNIACGHCFMCTTKHLPTQCETTQVHEYGSGAALLGYTKLYGQVAGGQAELLRVPQAQFGPIKVPEGPSDDRFLFLSDVLPTAWQAVQYTDTPGRGTICVIGLGPIGLMSARIAQHLGNRVLGIDLVPDRLDRARRDGIQVFDLDTEDLVAQIREATDGRGPDAVIDAVGMEAHGSPGAKVAQTAAGFLPDAVARKVFTNAGTDRMSVIELATELVMRGGTISLSGVYGGAASPMPLLRLFDKQVKLRMGQANVKRWVEDIMPLLEGSADPLGVEEFASHHVPLEEAPQAYADFQAKEDDTFKVVFTPGA